MKRWVLAGAVAAALLSSPPFVAQAQANGEGAKVQAAPDVKAFDQRFEQARAQMQRMQEQMDRIRQAKDPKERQRLMQEHWASMQETMSTMRGLWGPGMMGGGAPGGMHGPGMMGGPGMTGGPGGPGAMGWGGMHRSYSQLTPEQMKQRQYMMEQTMGMQQSMMDHMLQHQQWMMQTPPPAPK